MNYYLGIDVGSRTCDAVLIDENGKILSGQVLPTGARNQESAQNVRDQVLTKAGVASEAIRATVATGYGRTRVEQKDVAVTEITCHARGIRAFVEDARVLIDIGGQDSKAILLDSDGQVVDFVMNDKCAAGTGRFLETMARALNLELDEMSRLDVGAQGLRTLSSMCTVFAESEVVSLVADGTETKEIIFALNQAIAGRVSALVRRVCKETSGLRVAMSGGVARNPGVVRALGRALNCEIAVPKQPDLVGALGAALIARSRFP
ncbi:MAG: 2-hydroxyglutaryl-CoA dehydratase [Bdellovibrionales bacterium GWA2_49_15]|nr:MAG: 2-hydroxyglutaryl-CoA dehydratase [Bdellovibrionales bacterium GWA2_49_15]HAZ11474.1 2-hydroxyglutaryl-CoA dehydratase [Bdellovibrionales bacterium]